MTHKTLVPVKNYIFLLVPFICFLFYTGVLINDNSRLDLRVPKSRFNDLADAFLHRQLHLINTADSYDLVSYEGKFYLYWPPVPALVYMPLVALFGLQLPDALISILFGLANVYLVMRIIQCLADKFSIPIRLKELCLLGLFWGLGTVHFYMSMNGDVWFISQIIGQTFLLASILWFIRAFNAWQYFLSGLLFGLAVYTRNDLLFAAVLYAFIYAAKSGYRASPVLLRNAAAFLIPFVILSALNLWYNYARFGSVLDNGVNFHSMNPGFYEDFKQWGYLSPHYIPRNFYIEVMHFPGLSLKWPFINYDDNGFGFFWASPFFFLLIPALFSYYFMRKKLSAADTYIITGALISAMLIACVIFMVMGTGWAQFGARYTLDFYIFLLIAVVFVYKLFPASRLFHIAAFFFICLSIVINYCGVYLFYHLQ